MEIIQYIFVTIETQIPDLTAIASSDVCMKQSEVTSATRLLRIM